MNESKSDLTLEQIEAKLDEYSRESRRLDISVDYLCSTLGDPNPDYEAQEFWGKK